MRFGPSVDGDQRPFLAIGNSTSQCYIQMMGGRIRLSAGIPSCLAASRSWVSSMSAYASEFHNPCLICRS